MYTRKVIQMRKSLMVNLPKQVAEYLGLSKGDSCEICMSPGFGAVVRKAGGKGAGSAPIDEVYQGMRAASVAAQEFQRLVKIIRAKTTQGIERDLTSRVIGPAIIKLGSQLQRWMGEAWRKEIEAVRSEASQQEREKKARRIITRPRKKRARP